MVQYHKQPKTKASGTGGRRRAMRDKILAHYGGFFSRTHYKKEAQKEEREARRSKGGGSKQAGKVVLYASVSSKRGVKKAKILKVLESPDNPHFSRENLITKGAFIETELGKARVTSRPGQHGVVNAVLVEETSQSKALRGKVEHNPTVERAPLQTQAAQTPRAEAKPVVA